MTQQPLENLTPVVPEERIVVLDVLRGFALLGIMVMNMEGFNMPGSSWAMDPRPFQGALDMTVAFITTTVFAGKANSIFSFLFGLGMAIQLQRAETRGGGLVPVYLRRLLVLGLIGAAHATLLWNGDVLHAYAVLGLLLLAVRRASDRTLWILIAVFLVAPMLGSLYGWFAQHPPLHPLPHYQALAQEHIRVFQHGTYAEQVGVRLLELHEGYILSAPRLQGWMWLYPMFGVTMLLGFMAGRRRLFSDVKAHAATFRRVMVWCLGLGVAVAMAFALMMALRPKPTGLPTLFDVVGSSLYNLNRPLLCVGYVAAITLLFQRERVRRWLLPLASAGSMPLTNYLMQSVIATTIFYSHGFGLFGTVGPALGFVIAVAIFVMQVVYSRAWLRGFRFGPLEWLWRGAAYGRLPKLRAGP